MAYAAWSVTAGEVPTSTKWNILGTNDAGFNDGTNIAAGAINNTHMAALSLFTTKTTNSYKFDAYRSAAYTNTNAVIVIFEVKNFDTGSNYSTTTGLFTAPVAGWYYFYYQLWATSTTGYFSPALYKNGSLYRYSGGSNVSTANVNGNGMMVVQLAANDTVGVAPNTPVTSSAFVTNQAMYFGGGLLFAS